MVCQQKCVKMKGAGEKSEELKYLPTELCNPQFLHLLLRCVGRVVLFTYKCVLVRKPMQKQSLQNNSVSVLLGL